MMFVVPSIICGYLAAIPALAIILSLMFGDNSSVSVSALPSAGATLQASVLGLVIPLVSSILPIQSALNKELAEGLSSTRSKTKGQVVDITTEDSFSRKLPYLVFGGIGTTAGVLIYFVMPLSILSFNLGLLLEIFFLILIGMIFGLTLISFNLQRLLELIIVHTLLWYEKASMKILIVKNLGRIERATN